MGITHTFGGGSLLRGSPLRADSAWLAERLSDRETRFLLLRGLRPLVREEHGLDLVWSRCARVRGALEAGATTVFLGLTSDHARFALDLDTAPDAGELAAREGEDFMEVRAAALRLPGEQAAAVAQARSLLGWHSTHGFCARCGGPTRLVEAGYARRCLDPSCDQIHFPRTDPVVIMLVHRAGRCLLGRSVRARRFPEGLYSCLAGYVEPGESIEDAVRREVTEEAGVDVGRVEYHSSQPWPFPSSLMIGCLAEARSEELRIDPAELEDARWFTRAELQSALERWDRTEGLRLPPPFTIAHQLAVHWVRRRDATHEDEPDARGAAAAATRENSEMAGSHA